LATLLADQLFENGLKIAKQTEGGYHTHARDASKMVPTVQNAENITIQVPLLGAGTNSKNQDPRTGPPPKPIPTKNLRDINDR
jgi:hypothetical protein